MSFTHGGSGSGYSNYGCRCEACVVAHRTRVARRRAERIAQGAPPAFVEHGLSAYTNWGCRCFTCTEANKAHHRARRKAVSP